MSNTASEAAVKKESPVAAFIKRNSFYIGNLGFFIGFCQYSCSDVLQLRIMAICGSTCSIVYQFFTSPAWKVAVFWSIIYICLNSTAIYKIIMSGEVKFTKDELDLYNHLSGMMSLQSFKILMNNYNEWTSAPTGAVIAKQGEDAKILILITSGEVDLFLDDEYACSVGPGSLIGSCGFTEISKATDKYEMTAKVCEKYDKVRYITFTHEKMRSAIKQGGDILEGEEVKLCLNSVVDEMLKKDKAEPIMNYYMMMQSALVDSVVQPTEKKLLREFSTQHNISDNVHKQTLEKCNWTLEEYSDGKKHS